MIEIKIYMKYVILTFSQVLFQVVVMIDSVGGVK